MHNRFNYLRVIRDCLLRVISLDSVFFVYFLYARHPSRLTPDVEKCSLNISTFLPGCLFLFENPRSVQKKNCKKKNRQSARLYSRQHRCEFSTVVSISNLRAGTLFLSSWRPFSLRGSFSPHGLVAFRECYLK